MKCLIILFFLIYSAFSFSANLSVKVIKVNRKKIVVRLLKSAEISKGQVLKTNLPGKVNLKVKKVSPNGKKIVGTLSKKTGLKKGAKFKLVVKKLKKKKTSKKKKAKKRKRGKKKRRKKQKRSAHEFVPSVIFFLPSSMEISTGALDFPLAYGLSFDYRYTKLNKHLKFLPKKYPMSVSVGADFFMAQTATVDSAELKDITMPMYFHTSLISSYKEFSVSLGLVASMLNFEHATFENDEIGMGINPEFGFEYRYQKFNAKLFYRMGGHTYTDQPSGQELEATQSLMGLKLGYIF